MNSNVEERDGPDLIWLLLLRDPRNSNKGRCNLFSTHWSRIIEHWSFQLLCIFLAQRWDERSHKIKFFYWSILWNEYCTHTRKFISLTKSSIRYNCLLCMQGNFFKKKFNILNMCQAWKCERKELNESDFEPSFSQWFLMNIRKLTVGLLTWMNTLLVGLAGMPENIRSYFE